MKKQVRILLFAVLTVLMLALAVFGASAAGEFVAKNSKGTQIGKYDTLGEAVNAVTAGGTVEVQASVSVSETQTLSNNVAYTVKGKTGSEVVTFTGTAGLKITAGTVTMQNIGITAMGAHAVDIKGASANLTCQAGTTLISKGDTSNTGGALVFGGGATVEVNGGTYQGVFWANEVGTSSARTTVVVNGGSFSQNSTISANTTATAPYFTLFYIGKAYTDLTINGGTFDFKSTANMAAATSGLYLSSTTATATINGGTFTGSGSKQCGLIDKRNGTLIIDNLPDDGKCPVFNVTGEIIALWVRQPDAQVRTTINDGIFTQDAGAGSNKYFVVFQANLPEQAVVINGGTFITHAKDTYGITLGRANTTFAISLVINGGKFCATAGGESTRQISVFNGTNLTVNGGFFTYMDTLDGVAFNVDNIDVNRGSSYANSLGVTNGAGIYLKTDGTVNITGGTFMCGDAYQALNHREGNVTVTGGTFTSTGTDIIVVTAREGSLTITGGTFTLAAGTKAVGTILRTSVIAVDEGVGQYYDPTAVYQVSSVPITISGGRFNDFRDGNSRAIDTSVGSSLLTVTEIFILTNSRQAYFIDAGEGLGQDVKMGDISRAYYSGGVQYYAYMYSVATANAPVMVDGAAVELNPLYKDGNYNGIRFLSYIPASVVKNLPAGYTFGTLIAPADYVSLAGGFTHAKMDALYNTSHGFDLESNPAYVDIRAVDTVVTDANGNIHFSGALVALKEGNNDRGFAAVAYIKLPDGTYYYSAFDPSNNTRTMKDIAKQALTEYSDVFAAKGDEYVNPSIYKPGAYSRFNEITEQPLLQQYSGYYHTLTSETVTFTSYHSIKMVSDASQNLQSEGVVIRDTLDSFASVNGASRVTLVFGAYSFSTYVPLVEEALAEIDGEGYYIGVKYLQGSTAPVVVVVGTSNALTLQALQVFEKNYLKEGTVIIPELVHNSADVITLNTDMPMVFEHTRDGNYTAPHKTPDKKDPIAFTPDGSTNHIYNMELNGYGSQEGKYVDYPIVAGFEIGAAITAKGSTANFTDGYLYSFVPDNISVGSFHIEIGLTDYAQNYVLKGYDYGTYGYTIKDGRIVITAFDDATLRLAKQLFIDNLADFLVDGEYQIPTDFEYECLKTDGLTKAISAMASYETAMDANNAVSTQLASFQFITAVPRPALTLSGAVDVSDNSLQLYYNEDDVSLAAYTAYCKALKNAGYDVYMAERVVEDSRFVTYYNPDNGITLHVMYDAFAHAAEERVGKSSTLAELFKPTLRVIAAQVDDNLVKLLPKEYLSLQSYEKKTDTMITNVQITTGSAGYCYIYTLEDGSFVVLDGGGIEQVAKNAGVIYNTLAGLHQKITGAAPSADNKIKIAAWYLSHGHGDHMGTMKSFISTYVSTSSNTVEVEALIHNFPSNDESYNAYDPTLAIRNDYQGGNPYTNGTDSPIPYYKVHTGQLFFIRNLQFEVLYTHEDIHPLVMEYFNNTSTVIRLTALYTDGTGKPVADSTAVDNVVLGDLQVRGSTVMRARYGDYLKSDMVVVSHHGGNGAEAALYQLIDAQVLWWTYSAESISTRVDESSSTAYRKENVKWFSTTRWLYIFTINPNTTPTKTTEPIIESESSGLFDSTTTTTTTTTTTETLYNLTVTLTENGFPGLYSRLESDTSDSLATKQAAAQKLLVENLFAMQVVAETTKKVISISSIFGSETSTEYSYTYTYSVVENVVKENEYVVTLGSEDDYVMGRQDLSFELPVTLVDLVVRDAVDDPFVDGEILEIVW